MTTDQVPPESPAGSPASGQEPQWPAEAHALVEADRRGELEFTQIDCAGCMMPLDDGSGRVVVAGGDNGNVYYHERCVQP